MSLSNLGQDIQIKSSSFGTIWVNYDYQPEEKNTGTHEAVTINFINGFDCGKIDGNDLAECHRDEIIEAMYEEKNRSE